MTVGPSPTLAILFPHVLSLPRGKSQVRSCKFCGVTEARLPKDWDGHLGFCPVRHRDAVEEANYR